MEELITLEKEYVAQTYGRFPVVIKSGKGSTAYDENGKEYIDLGSGIAVNSFGYADKQWCDAVYAQMNLVQHTSNLYYSEPCILLAKELCERTGMKKVFFSNSGAEANECAIKAARKYSQDKYGKQRYKIITLKNSFHGRTLTTLAATGQDVFHELFTPITEGFIYAEANNISDVREKLSDDVCAVMFEPIQGEGGVMPLEKDFLCELEKLAKEKDVLLICDEVQTGNGRSGKLYAYMNFGITPDIVSTAKGLAGGLPLGATLLGKKVSDVLTPGTHGSTFGGNPVCCAGALNILSRLDDKMLSEIREKSELIFKTLGNAKGIKSVSGMGLMIGLETERNASDIANECLEKGVLVLKAKSKVRLLPALNIPKDKLSEALAVIKEVCAK